MFGFEALRGPRKLRHVATVSRMESLKNEIDQGADVDRRRLRGGRSNGRLVSRHFALLQCERW
jgi:hypothetical protein